MSDIFISYSSKDKKNAKELAEVLIADGWSVWWDRKIPPGQAFDEVISKALDNAGCIIVLWSNNSVNSNWVKEEASEGLRGNILVPVLIEDSQIPLGFRRIQAARLVGWRKNLQDHEFLQLILSVKQILNLQKTTTLPDSNYSSQSFQAAEVAAALKETQPKISRRMIITTLVTLSFFGAGYLFEFIVYLYFSQIIGRDIAALTTWAIGMIFSVIVWKRLGK